MSKQQIITAVERKDTNLAHRLETDHKIPIEYTKFRDSVLENLREMGEIQCKTYVPQLYSILKQAGLSPIQARAVVLKDGTELFHWSPITIDKAITDPEAKDQVKAKAGRISASVKKQKKLVTNAVTEASHRGPGRPPKEVTEQIFSTVVDCNEFLKEFTKVADLAAKAGTNKAKIEISSAGKLNVSVYLVGATITA